MNPPLELASNFRYGASRSYARDHGTAENAHRIVIDFAGGKLGKVPTQEVLHGMVAVQGGDQVAEIRDQHVVTNPHIDGWRLSFQVVPKTRALPYWLIQITGYALPSRSLTEVASAFAFGQSLSMT